MKCMHMVLLTVMSIVSIIFKTAQKNNIKITAGRKQKSINVDINAYEKGIVDSKAIDLNQQAIENR